MRIFFIITSLFICSSLLGQIQESGQPESFKLVLNNTFENVPTLSYSLSDGDIRAGNDTAYDVGVAELVDINYFASAQRTILENDVVVVQLRIQVEHALGVGLNFDQFYLPEHGKLFAYNSDRSILLGAYTSKNNQTDGKFSIQPILGNSMILEYNQPSFAKPTATLNIDRVAKIYRPIFGSKRAAQSRSSSCYTDVHCIAGLEVERSVLKWLYYNEKDESYHVCSCVLMNQDVSEDNVKPYILTANHCGNNADLSTAIFYFNYQNSMCGNNNAYAYNYTMSGGNKRAKRVVYDMFLLELNEFPPPDYNVHLGGLE